MSRPGRPRKFPPGTECRFSVKTSKDVRVLFQEQARDLGITQSELLARFVDFAQDLKAQGRAHLLGTPVRVPG